MQTLLAFTWIGTKPTIALDVPSRPTVFTAFTTLNILTKFFEDFGVEKVLVEVKKFVIPEARWVSVRVAR